MLPCQNKREAWVGERREGVVRVCANVWWGKKSSKKEGAPSLSLCIARTLRKWETAPHGSFPGTYAPLSSMQEAEIQVLCPTSGKTVFPLWVPSWPEQGFEMIPILSSHLPPRPLSLISGSGAGSRKSPLPFSTQVNIKQKWRPSREHKASPSPPPLPTPGMHKEGGLHSACRGGEASPLHHQLTLVQSWGRSAGGERREA